MDKESEIDRILNMSDAELLAEAEAQGIDVRLEAARLRAMFEDVKRRIDAQS